MRPISNALLLQCISSLSFQKGSFCSTFSHHIKYFGTRMGRRMFSGGTQLRKGRIVDVLAIIGPCEKLSPYTYLGDFYAGSIRECGKNSDFLKGRGLHVSVLKLGFGADLMVSNGLLGMYVKGESLKDAHRVFDEMPLKDLASWCILINGSSREGNGLIGVRLYKEMLGDGFLANQFVLASVTKTCACIHDLGIGRQVHSQIVKMGFVSDEFLIISLIDMYSKCGDLGLAMKVLNEISVRSSVCWNTMITGCFQNGFVDEGMMYYGEMRMCGCASDVVTLRIILTEGMAAEDLEFCNNVHVYAIKAGMHSDSVIANEFLRLQAMIGNVEGTYRVLKSKRNLGETVSQAVILGLTSRGNLISILDLCQNVDEGLQIHAYILKTGCDSDISVANAMISMYSKYGSMEVANIIFNEMNEHDLLSWTALITGYARNFMYKRTIEAFCLSKEHGFHVDKFVASTIINLCTESRDMELGKQIQTSLIKMGLECSKTLRDSILRLYAVCGTVETVRKLFLLLPKRDALATNIMLEAYVRHGQYGEALEFFYSEHRNGLVLNKHMISRILSACAYTGSLCKGAQMHSCITKSGFTSILDVENNLIKFYAKCSDVASAYKYFESMESKTLDSYTMVVSGFIYNVFIDDAMRLFHSMHSIGLRATSFVFTSLLKGCVDLAAVEQGKELHALVVKLGFSINLELENSLTDMYAKSSCTKGTEMRDDILIQDEVSWNSLFAELSKIVAVSEPAELMNLLKVCQEPFNYLVEYSTSAKDSSLRQVSLLHFCAEQTDLRHKMHLSNFPVDISPQCLSAKNLLATTMRRNVFSWNSTSTQNTEFECANEGLELLKELMGVGVRAEHMTYLDLGRRAAENVIAGKTYASPLNVLLSSVHPMLTNATRVKEAV